MFLEALWYSNKRSMSMAGNESPRLQDARQTPLPALAEGIITY